MKFFCLGCLMLGYLNCYAINYYVSAQKGNHKYSGLTPSAPKKNINEAAALSRPGDTVFVMNGTYVNTCPACNVVDITRSGNALKYIVYANYRGQHPVIKFTGWIGIAITNGASYIKIMGFEIIGANAKISLTKALRQQKSCANPKGDFEPLYNGNGIVVDGKTAKHSHHIVIAKNIIHDCSGGGIGATHADYITVEGNLVYNTSWYTVFGTSGIAFYQFWNFDNARGYHNVIANNRCYNNRSLVPWVKTCQLSDGNGIIVDDFRNKQNGSKLGPYRNRTLIQNNVCWYNGGTGIHTFQSDHVDMINNTAYCNSRTKGLNAGQILSGLSYDNRIVNNILVADSGIVINSNFHNSRLTYCYNLHFNITHPKREIVRISDKTCITGVNPQFIMPGNNLNANFNLKNTSPALRHGHPRIFSRVDFNGKKRALHNAPDLGAYEN